MKLGYRTLARNLLAGKVLRVFLIGGVVFLTTVTVLAKGLDYTLEWWSVDGGGGFSAGNGYTLGGAAGQLDAGVALTGGGYTLVGGMWTGTGSAESLCEVYVPLVLKE